MISFSGSPISTDQPRHNRDERSGTPDSQTGTSGRSLGPHTLQQLDAIESDFRQCVWSIRHRLDNLRLTPEEYHNAGQSIFDRAAGILEVVTPRIRVTDYSSSERSTNINITIPQEHIRESLNQLLSLLSSSSFRSERPHSHSMPSYNPPRHHDHSMYSDIPPEPSNAYHHSFIPSMPSQDRIPFPPPPSYSHPPHPSSPHPSSPQSSMEQESSAPDQRRQQQTQQQTPGHAQTDHQIHPQTVFRMSFHSTPRSEGFPAMGTDIGSLNSLLTTLLGTEAASQPGTGSHSDPVGIERLLCMVPTTQEAFKDMKNLMVIRGENPLLSFDKEHLIKQWTNPGNKGEIDKILNAISKKPDYLNGVDVKELKNKVPKEQGLFFLKSLLKHSEKEPNIQMLAYLKLQGFLKQIEPTIPSGATHTPEYFESPGSNTATGNETLPETLGQMSVEPEKRTGIDDSTLDPGNLPDGQGNDDTV